jgi:hypothetical protein
MRRRVFIPAALALAAALLGACKATDTAGNVSASAAASKAGGKSNASVSAPPAGTTTVHADGIRRVGVAELQKMVEAGTVAIYDTRSKMQYDQEHIKGALSLPQHEAESRAGELPRDKTLVFYCT